MSKTSDKRSGRSLTGSDVARSETGHSSSFAPDLAPRSGRSLTGSDVARSETGHSSSFAPDLAPRSGRSLTGPDVARSETGHNVSRQTLVIGDACVDLVVSLPEKSGTAEQPPPPTLHGGGTGGNTAVALTRLQVPTALLGTVGDDGFGRFAITSLETEGVDTQYLTIDREAFTVQVLALIDPQGERTLYGWPRRGGAHTCLSPADVTPEIIQQMGWVHTTGMCLVESPIREATLHGMALAQAAGIPVSFDINLRLGFENGQLPEPFLDTIHQAIKLSDVVFGSATDELVYLTPDLPSEASARLLSEGKRTFIVRLDADGAMIVPSDGEASLIPAFPVSVVDTTGAGDVFNAGFIAARLDGASLEESVYWGNAAAALKIGQVGARSSPTRAGVEELLENR